MSKKEKTALIILGNQNTKKEVTMTQDENKKDIYSMNTEAKERTKAKIKFLTDLRTTVTKEAVTMIEDDSFNCKEFAVYKALYQHYYRNIEASNWCSVENLSKHLFMNLGEVRYIIKKLFAKGYFKLPDYNMYEISDDNYVIECNK